MNRFRSTRLAGLLIILLGWLLGWATMAHADDTRFLSVIDDLPLMAGLAEHPDAALVFDGPTGRIVETYASGQLSAEAVTGFYAATLPQLGWQPQSGGGYRRDNEILKLEIGVLATDLSGVRIRFVLKPLESKP